jgi:orotidine-5'-phosphate decarboxylase
LGIGSLSPFFEAATKSSRGAFILAATSNTQSRIMQSARTSSEQSVEEFVMSSVRDLNAQADSLGSFGIVLGATRERPRFDVTTLRGPILVPGIGSQGATPDSLARLFDRCEPGTVLASVSRAFLEKGPERAALRDSAQRWRDDLSAALA